MLSIIDNKSDFQNQRLRIPTNIEGHSINYGFYQNIIKYEEIYRFTIFVIYPASCLSTGSFWSQLHLFEDPTLGNLKHVLFFLGDISPHSQVFIP